MQTMQRKFGKLTTKSSADGAQVAVLMSDFEDADRMLTRLIDASKAWRDSWRDIFSVQERLINEFQSLYNPIVGAGDSYSGHEPIQTPQSTYERVEKLHEGYDSLKVDMLEEVNMVDTRIIRPATEAKEFIQPLKKVIKKREDRKLDFERYNSKVDSGRKKAKRSDKENATLAKNEQDLAQAKSEYELADDHLKSTLPPLITATYSILPHLLAAQILTQNSLLGQYYTQLHTYCQEENFPSPPPPMTEIISVWEADFRSTQHDVETGIACIAGGKAVRQPMKMEDRNTGPSMTGLNLRNGYAARRAGSQPAIQAPRKPSLSPARGDHAIEAAPSPAPEETSRPRISSVPSQTSLALSTPDYGASSAGLSPSPHSAHAPAGPRADYFARDRLPSGASMQSAIAGKKKPPPPPPKRLPSHQGAWVTALYDFAGQGQGDLVFKEGDRIKVVKKTDSTDDWWEGELQGVHGSFPANYCKAT